MVGRAKEQDTRKGALKKGEAVVVQLGAEQVRATVVRGESPGRPVVLRTESGQLMTAFPATIARVAS